MVTVSFVPLNQPAIILPQPRMQKWTNYEMTYIDNYRYHLQHPGTAFPIDSPCKGSCK